MNLKNTSKKLVATVALAGAVTAGTAGAAFAADSTPSGTSAPSAQAANHPRLAIRRALGGIVADALGVSRADLRTALKGGQSINEYAASLPKDPQVVVDAVTSAVDARIDQAVANGKITADRGATLKSKVPARVAKGMDHHFGQAST